MPISPARAAAFDILLRVDWEHAYASELLHSSQYQKLSAVDHGLATELVMGVLRWRSSLDERLARFSSQKLEKLDAEVLTALRLAAYQVLFLDRIPTRAAVHESVELVKRARKTSAASFANAVLRKLASNAGQFRQSDSLDDANTVSDLSARSAHPAWLVEHWVQELGFDAAKQICIFDQAAPETAVRLADASVESELEKDGVLLGRGRVLCSARRLLAGDLTKARAFREGRVAIQDEASQLVALLVGGGSHILDCCAAPGGKTRVLAERNPQAEIVALELHPHRARLLRRLVPAKNVQVVTTDACDLSPDMAFDRVLADVPCSGTGTLGRNPEIKWRLKPEDLTDLQARQLAILRSGMKHLAPGGRLVYATCSLEREENEAVLENALGADSSFRVRDCRTELERLRKDGELARPDPGSLARGPYLRTVPGVHPCDGFFAAIIEKT